MAHSKLYIKLMNSSEWRETRNRKIEANPLCELCLRDGYVTASRCVHHIIPVESGRTEKQCRELAFSWNNLQALCLRCHADIHQAERSHSRAAHQQREADRLAAWVERHKHNK